MNFVLIQRLSHCMARLPSHKDTNGNETARIEQQWFDELETI